jgi:hypothetical protein
MDRHQMRLLVVAFSVVVGSRAISAQNAAATILQVDVENFVRYVEDITDPSKFATSPAVTPAAVPRNFVNFVAIADIVAVNGQPAKGTYLSRGRTTTLSPTPAAGSAIADTTRTGAVDTRFEILSADGTPIGTVLALEFGGGPPPPGAPLEITQGNNVIVGGSGAYLGARGSFGQAVTAQSVATRQASITEDPANRRRNGGGKTRFVLQVIAMTRPEILLSGDQPLIAHASDSKLVTSSNPATAGETLSLFVSGLGPTRPGVDPGQPFPSSPLAVVNSPIQVTVNGRPAFVVTAAGFPSRVDTYQVQFQVPPGTAAGTAAIQVSVAWVPGPGATVAIR